MQDHDKNSPRNVVEDGIISFFYRPKIGHEMTLSLADIGRLYIVLHPKQKNIFRLLRVGKKQMPDNFHMLHEVWGYVEKITRKETAISAFFKRQTYSTKTRGIRTLPEARNCGQGHYSIAVHDNHEHFCYELDAPPKAGLARDDLHIHRTADLLLNIKNPQQPSPEGVGLKIADAAKYPKKMQDYFQHYRFISRHTHELLNYEKTQFLLIDVSSGQKEKRE